MTREKTLVECAYCGAEHFQQAIPAVDDDDGWERVATDHAPDCEWVLTRAHRIDDQMESITVELRLDFDLLRKQKYELVKLRAGLTTQSQFEALSGAIHLIDEIQDQSIVSGDEQGEA